MEPWLYITFLILAIILGLIPGGNFLYLFGMAALFDAWGEPITSILGLWLVGLTANAFLGLTGVGTILAVINVGILMIWGGLFIGGMFFTFAISAMMGTGIAIRYNRKKDDITRRCITLIGHDLCIGKNE